MTYSPSIIAFNEQSNKEEGINFFMMEREDLLQAIANDASFPKALNYRFLIALPIIEEKTKSGLIQLASMTMDTAYIGMNIGRIMSVGGTVGGANGSYKDCRDLQVGDYVHYNPHVGLPLNYNHTRFISVNDESIINKLFDPLKHTDGIFEQYSIKGIA